MSRTKSPFFLWVLLALLVSGLFLFVACGDEDTEDEINPFENYDYDAPVQVAITDNQFRFNGSGVTPLDLEYIKDLFRDANQIDIACTAVDNQEMVDFFIDLAESGTLIRMVTERGFRENPDFQDLYLDLQEAGVIIRNDNDGLSRYMHSKFAILDNSTILVGSGDFLSDAFMYSLNNTLIIEDSSTVGSTPTAAEVQTLADAFIFEFYQMFDLGLFGQDKNVHLKRDFMVGDTEMSVHFGPGNAGNEVYTNVLNLIDSASSVLVFNYNQFTSEEVGQRLLQASARLADRGDGSGLTALYGIVDNSAPGPKTLISDVVPALEDYLDFYAWGTFSGLNHKFMMVDPFIIDEDEEDPDDPPEGSNRLLTGSANWTQSGLFYNDESVIIVKENQDLMGYYIDEFFKDSQISQAIGTVRGKAISFRQSTPIAVEIIIYSSPAGVFPGQEEPAELGLGEDDEDPFSVSMIAGQIDIYCYFDGTYYNAKANASDDEDNEFTDHEQALLYPGDEIFFEFVGKFDDAAAG